MERNEPYKLNHKSPIILKKDRVTVLRRGASKTHANAVGKIVERSIGADNKYTYQIIKVQWRDFDELYIVSKKKHTKEFLKLRAEV